jgi:hypothetical protein
MHPFCSSCPGQAGAEILPQRPSPTRFVARVSQEITTQPGNYTRTLVIARPNYLRRWARKHVHMNQ